MSKTQPIDLVAFLHEAARYFEKRDTGGEDMAFWANVTNAENCRTAAHRLENLQRERDEARETLEAIGAPDEVGLVSVSDSVIRGMYYAAIRVARDVIERAALATGEASR